VRTAEFRAQPQRNRYAHGLVVKPKPASSDRQRQKPVATMCRACCLLLLYSCWCMSSHSLSEESRVRGLSGISGGMSDYGVLFLAVA